MLVCDEDAALVLELEGLTRACRVGKDVTQGPIVVVASEKGRANGRCVNLVPKPVPFGLEGLGPALAFCCSRYNSVSGI